MRCSSSWPLIISQFKNSAPSSCRSAFPKGWPGALAGLYNACAAGLGPPICTTSLVGDLTGRWPFQRAVLTGDRRWRRQWRPVVGFIDASGALGCADIRGRRQRP